MTAQADGGWMSMCIPSQGKPHRGETFLCWTSISHVSPAESKSITTLLRQNADNFYSVLITLLRHESHDQSFPFLSASFKGDTY